VNDVAQIEPVDLLAAEVLHRARGLCWAEIAAAAEQCRDEALAPLVDPGLEARERPEERVQIEPLFGIGQDVEERTVCIPDARMSASTSATDALASAMPLFRTASPFDAPSVRTNRTSLMPRKPKKALR